MFDITSVNYIKLRIKNRHLSEEVKIIKHELQRKQLKVDSQARSAIESHLNNTVRTEVRATQLTIAFLTGKDYNSIESKSDQSVMKHYIIPRMASMISKYGQYYSIYDHILPYMEWAKKNDSKEFKSSMTYFKYKDIERQTVIKKYIEEWMTIR